MKNKTKRLIYKISVVVLIACTIFMVLVGTCFGASLTYPPDYVVATFDKSSWYNPDVTIQGVDCYKPQYYLDDISFDTNYTAVDNVSGLEFSPTQLSLGSPFYRYIPKIVFASDIRSTLTYDSQIDFVNSYSGWVDGEALYFNYNVDYRYYYGAPYGNTIMSEFYTGYNLPQTGDYFSLTLSDMVINMTNSVDYIQNSVPSLTLSLVDNTLQGFTYNTMLYIEYESVEPIQVDGEWMYQRDIGTKSILRTFDVGEEEYIREHSFNLLTDYYDELRDILDNNVNIVKSGTVVPSNYLYIKRLIYEVYDEYGTQDGSFGYIDIEYRNEWLTENNYFRNSLSDYQEHIGTYKEIQIEYDYGIDFSDFINSVASIFDIELFAGFTLLDILTGVVGVFVLVWFLKVFAGG